MSKKKNQSGQDVIKALAKTTSLTIPQVQELFLAYEKLINTVKKSNYADELTIALPYIGKISFIEKKGRKAGTVYRRPNEFKKGEKATDYIVEEDEPNYLRLKFDFLPLLQKETKELSISRYMKKKNSIYKERVSHVKNK